MESFSASLAFMRETTDDLVTGPLWGQSSDAELWCFLWSAQTIEQKIVTPVTWDTMCSFWRHCKASSLTDPSSLNNNAFVDEFNACDYTLSVSLYHTHCLFSYGRQVIELPTLFTFLLYVCINLQRFESLEKFVWIQILNRILTLRTVVALGCNLDVIFWFPQKNLLVNVYLTSIYIVADIASFIAVSMNSNRYPLYVIHS